MNNEQLTSAQIKLIEATVSRLKALGYPLELKAKSTIISDGEVSKFCYIVEEGTVCSIRYTVNGGKRIYWDSSMVDINDPVVLLAAALTQRPVTINLITHTDVKLIKVSSECLFSAMEHDPVVGAGISLILASRFMDVNSRFHKSEEANFEQRFYELLIFYSQEYGEPYENKILIKTKLSQQDMADTLHVDRTTVARCIKQLKDCNQLERVNDFYCIKDLNAIKEKYDSIS